MYRTLTITALLLLLLGTAAPAQPSERNSVWFSAPAEPWSVWGYVGMTVTILPRPIAEEEIRQIPMVDFGTRLALPLGFSLVAGVSSNVLTTAAAGALQWSLRYGNYSIALGDRHSFWYGTAPIEGFDVSAFGWMNHPFVTIGADYREVRVFLRGELTYVLSRTTRVGTHQIAFERNPRAGGSLMAAIEQPFVDSTDVTIGLRLNVTDSAVQSWLAFTTFRDKLIFPEILFSVRL